MKTSMTIGASALALVVGSAVAVGQVSTFVILSPAPGDNAAFPEGISGDGSTVFGASALLGGGNSEAYRWTASQGAQDIGALISGPFSRALASSTNGLRVFGEDNVGGGFEWTSPGTITSLSGGRVIDVSADGSVRLTTSQRIGVAATPLPALPGDQDANCRAMSADGNAVALTSHFFESGGGGYGYGGGDPDIVRDQACRWTASGGTVGCGFLPDTDRSFATNISEDGAVVLGVCRNGGSGSTRGFRWTSAGGISELLPIVGQPIPTNVEPVDSSADGSVVVCEVDGAACVWTEAGGFRPLKQILLANGLDVGPWVFYSIAGVSDDGRIVTGNALDASGNLAAFVTPLDTACQPPANPWTATRRVIVADGDALPGGGTASSVREATVAGSGAALVRSGSDVWLSPAGGGALVAVATGVTGGFIGVESVALSDSGIVAITRLSTLTGQGNARTLQVGPVGGLVTIAANGDAVPVASGGGSLATYTGFDGPFVNGGGLAAFQSRVDGGTLGTTQLFAYNAANPAGLVRFAPAVTLTSPFALALSDSGAALWRAAEGLAAGGPPPATTPLIAPTGGAAPGIVGGTFTSFPRAVINGAGTVAFRAAVSTPGGTVSAVYRTGSGGSLQLVAKTGSSLGDGLLLQDAQDVQIAENGSVYFAGNLQSSGDGVVVKARPDGSMVVIARDGDELPGNSACRTMNGWQLRGVDGRRVLLAASVGGLSGTSQALVVWGEGEPLSVLTVTGGSETFRPGLAGPVGSLLLSSQNGNGHDGRNSSFSGGRVVYSALVTDAQNVTRRVVVEESLPVLPCGTADVGTQGGGVGPDGLLNNNDFVAFIDLFFSADPRADVGSQGGIAGSDGLFNNNDFVVFIDRFFAGCT